MGYFELRKSISAALEPEELVCFPRAPLYVCNPQQCDNVDELELVRSGRDSGYAYGPSSEQTLT